MKMSVQYILSKFAKIVSGFGSRCSFSLCTDRVCFKITRLEDQSSVWGAEGFREQLWWANLWNLPRNNTLRGFCFFPVVPSELCAFKRGTSTKWGKLKQNCLKGEAFMAPELRGAKAAAKKVWCPRNSYEISPERVERGWRLIFKEAAKKRAAEVLIMGKTSARLFSWTKSRVWFFPACNRWRMWGVVCLLRITQADFL